MLVTRITLDIGGAGLDHRRLFYQNIVPSLYDYVRFIYSLRSDESLRLAFLAADDETRFGFIAQHLPFVQRPRFSGIERGDSSSRMKEKSNDEAVDVMVVDGEDGQQRLQPRQRGERLGHDSGNGRRCRHLHKHGGRQHDSHHLHPNQQHR